MGPLTQEVEYLPFKQRVVGSSPARPTIIKWNIGVKLPAHRAGLPGNVDLITGSAFLPAYKAGHPADLPVIVDSK